MNKYVEFCIENFPVNPKDKNSFLVTDEARGRMIEELGFWAENSPELDAYLREQVRDLAIILPDRQPVGKLKNYFDYQLDRYELGGWCFGAVISLALFLDERTKVERGRIESARGDSLNHAWLKIELTPGEIIYYDPAWGYVAPYERFLAAMEPEIVMEIETTMIKEMVLALPNDEYFMNRKKLPRNERVVTVPFDRAEKAGLYSFRGHLRLRVEGGEIVKVMALFR